MTAAQLVVLRHGRTSWNATGRFQGQADIGLDERGLAPGRPGGRGAGRARAVGHLLFSDLSRATQTAEPLARACGLPVTTDPRLREIHVGSWEGLTIDEMFSQLDDDLKRAYLAGEDVRRSPTGETVAEVGERAGVALEEIGQAAADGSHGGGGDARAGRAGRRLPAARLPDRDLEAAERAAQLRLDHASSGTAPATTGGSPSTT